MFAKGGVAPPPKKKSYVLCFSSRTIKSGGWGGAEQKEKMDEKNMTQYWSGWGYPDLSESITK